MPDKRKVKFQIGSLQVYKSITPDNYTFYYTSDTKALYLGTTRLSNVEIQTTAEWNSNRQFVGQAGVFYIYSDYRQEEYIDHDGHKATRYIPGLKIGDGNAYLIDSPFINDQSYMITQQERNFWNNKISFPGNSNLYAVGDDQKLVFTTGI